MKKFIEKTLIFLGLRQLGIEGSSSSRSQLLYLQSLVRKYGAKYIAEIGFNAGFASRAFLEVNPDIEVISFDLGEYDHVGFAKEKIDRDFPGRHILIYGNSKETVPVFLREHPEIKFDFVFIDGGHDYETAQADIENMKKASKKGALVVLDDATPLVPWGIGPTRAWKDAVKRGLVTQKEIVKEGIRAWALGVY